MPRLTQAESQEFKAAVTRAQSEADKNGSVDTTLFVAGLVADTATTALVLAKAHADALVAELKARDERHAEHLRRLETRVAALERGR